MDLAEFIRQNTFICNCGNNTYTTGPVVANCNYVTECKPYCNATNIDNEQSTVNNTQICETENGLSSNNENSKV